MLGFVLFAGLTQISAIPDEFYRQEYSDETIAVVSDVGVQQGEKIARALEQLAERGDASAYEALGEIYANGSFGIPRDAVRGCDYFEKVGDRRADALHNLATCYYSGDGRRQDYVKARQLYAQAADGGWRMAFCAYGNMLVRSEGGPENKTEGIRLCRATAILGDPDAQTDYGTYLLTGNGVERDPVAARFMLEQAAAQNQRNAAFLLGQIHTRGDGTPVDHAAASEWFERAYDWGRRDAAYEAARSYLRRGYIQKEDGTATVRPELLSQCLAWLEKAEAVEPAGSERQTSAADLARLVGKMIAAAGQDWDD